MYAGVVLDCCASNVQFRLSVERYIALPILFPPPRSELTVHVNCACVIPFVTCRLVGAFANDTVLP